VKSNIEEITFGVELETTIPASAQIRVGGYHAGAPVMGANAGEQSLIAPKFNGAAWKAERDGSIMIDKPGHVACEFVSPILKGEAGVRHLLEFVDFLRATGAKVNRSCGLHIHLGIEGAANGEELTEYVERLTRLVAFNSKALYAQTGTLSRELGCFCRPIGDQTKSGIRQMKRTKSLDAAARANRYHILNLTNLTFTGTVEFRCFAGTTNRSKILLHLFSVLALALIARKAKSPAAWQNETLTGTKAVTNFLKVRPVTRIVGAEVFEENFPKILSKALEMAGQYDSCQAAHDAAVLSRPTQQTPNA
jgi:hypothetical protein